MIDRDEEFDFGYADITKYSSLQKEEEVLFNPLNSFTITNFQKLTNYRKEELFGKAQCILNKYYPRYEYELVLSYGITGEIAHKMNKKAKLNQKELEISYQLQFQQSSVRWMDTRALMFKNALTVNEKDKLYYYEKFRERLRDYADKYGYE